MPLDQLPDLSSDYQIANDQHDTYQHDGHIILRGVAAAEEVQAYRPLITGIVDEMARAKDRQGRICDYSAMFTQVTNVWRMSDAVRRFVFAKRFAKIDTSQEYFERIIREQEIEIRSYELRAGDATFHSGRTLHAAHGNGSKKRREVMTIIYYADGTRIMEPDNEYQKVDTEVFHPGLKPGDIAASELNPLLHTRS